MSKPSSRKVRTGQTSGRPSAPRDRGIREWMETLQQDRRRSFAAFDTHLNKPSWLTGSAARSIRKALKRCGYAEIMKRQSFRVAHSDGPLVEGELDRAVAWGRELAAKLETAD